MQRGSESEGSATSALRVPGEPHPSLPKCLLSRYRLGALAVLSGSVVIGNLALNDVSEVFYIGDELGELLSDLGLAYLSGYVFHWLVVVLPRRRDRRNVIRHLRVSVYGVIHSVMWVNYMARRAGFTPRTNLTLEEWSLDDFERICSAVHPHEEAPVMMHAHQGSWIEWARSSTANAQEHADTILKHLLYLEAWIPIRRSCTTSPAASRHHDPRSSTRSCRRGCATTHSRRIWGV